MRTHAYTHRLTHATHTFTATLSYSGRPPSRPFQCISQSGAVGAGANTSHIEPPANEPLAHRTDIRMEHVPAPPAPNHYAHNHLKAKEDGEHICMVGVTGARSLDCKRRLAPYSLDVYQSRSFNLSLTLNDACMKGEIIAVIVFVE